MKSQREVSVSLYVDDVTSEVQAADYVTALLDAVLEREEERPDADDPIEPVLIGFWVDRS